MDGLEFIKEDLEFNSGSDWKPVQILQEGGNMMKQGSLGDDATS